MWVWAQCLAPNPATGVAEASALSALVPSPDKMEDCVRKGIRCQTCAKSNMRLINQISIIEIDDALWWPLRGAAKRRRRRDVVLFCFVVAPCGISILNLMNLSGKLSITKKKSYLCTYYSFGISNIFISQINRTKLKTGPGAWEQFSTKILILKRSCWKWCHDLSILHHNSSVNLFIFRGLAVWQTNYVHLLACVHSDGLWLSYVLYGW